ncbi:MAG TPA: hypothetical protein VKD65_17280, partial [Candidatus Angelobacter sp.]|nr:hypothetical protein [Candidatus Angelobacter sp.]
MIKPLFVLGLILASFSLFAQQTPTAPPDQQKSNPPAAAPQQKSNPPAAAPEQKSAPPAPTVGTQVPGTQAPAVKKPDRAAAYYHYGLAHMYEEMAAMYGRSEFANKAIEEYRLAIENDPSSEYLNAGLAELYAKTGRIRDAVTEAQEIIKRDP